MLRVVVVDMRQRQRAFVRAMRDVSGERDDDDERYGDAALRCQRGYATRRGEMRHTRCAQPRPDERYASQALCRAAMRRRASAPSRRELPRHCCHADMSLLIDAASLL